ncbi:MAG: 4Fe-4S dicluster domain-containing protein, partial [Candidatus Thorarchaeota archaeon]
QQHLDSMPVGFPATESGVEIRILKQLFTQEEARIATKLRFATHPSDTLDDIIQRIESVEYSRDELETILDTMVSKGLLLFRKEESKKYYNNAQWIVGIYEFQVNKMTADLFNDIVDYNIETFGRVLHGTNLPQLRVIPIGKSIEHNNEVANYDDVRELVSSSKGPFLVANCICRQAMDLVDNPCKATDRRETCIAFGTMAQMYIDQDWGREVSKDELLEIIQQNQKDGLVLQPSNARTLDFLCSCCGCCCGILFGTKMSRKPVKFFSTNFYAEVDSELCTLCGNCVELCQMEAITLEDDTVVIDLNRCIGCGVCVANCPSDALALKKHSEERVPPDTIDDLYSKISEKK